MLLFGEEFPMKGICELGIEEVVLSGGKFPIKGICVLGIEEVVLIYVYLNVGDKDSVYCGGRR